MSCTPNDSTAPAFLTHFQAVEDPRQRESPLSAVIQIPFADKLVLRATETGGTCQQRAPTLFEGTENFPP